MKVVPMEEGKEKFDEYLELTRQEDIIVTKEGKVTAMLHALSDEDLGDYLFENDPRFMAIIEARRKQYRREGGIPLAQLAQELGIE
jgi:hypothetical protein